MIQRPTLAWPPAVHGGTFAVIEAGSAADVGSAVDRIMSCTVGDLPDRPAFGLPALELRREPPDPEDIVATIEAQEPRATVTALTMPGPGEGWASLDVEIAPV